MSIADELKTLQELRDSGALTQDEFVRAKQSVLDGDSAGVRDPDPFTHNNPGHTAEEQGLVENIFGGKKQTLGDAANRYVSLQTILSIVGLIIALIFFFAFFLPNWNSMSDRHEQMQQDFDRKWDSFPVSPPVQ